MKLVSILQLTVILAACSTNNIAVNRESENMMFDTGENIGQPNSTDSSLVEWCFGQPSAAINMVSGNPDMSGGVNLKFKRPGPYTASFTFQPVDDVTGATTAPVRAQAIIKWMVGGIVSQRRISIVSGTSIQGVSESVTIQVLDATVASGLGVVFGKAYMVFVSVAPGGRGSYETPPILFERSTASGIGPGVTTDFAIPQDAGVKSELILIGSSTGTMIPDQGVVISQINAQGTVLCSYDAREYNWVPLLPGAVFTRVHNTTAATILMTTIFGIDG